MGLTDMEENKLLEPFNVYVVWDQAFSDGNIYAKAIFNEFYRMENDYTGESLGIPVKFIVSHEFDIDGALNNSKYAAIILLIDNKFVLNRDKWLPFIKLVADRDSEEIRTYPVALCDVKAVTSNFKIIAKKNLIFNQAAIFDREEKIKSNLDILIFDLTHEFCRLLYGYNRISDLENVGYPAAVNAFLSYAREDGIDYAYEFNTYLTSNTALDRFIDCCNIRKGDDFEKTIDKSIESAALLIIYTDSYSSREWCQHEVLYAKKKDRPILLVDMLKDGEKRRFPYMANIRTIHFEGDKLSNENKRLILLRLLFETLRVKYSEMYLEYVCELYGVKDVLIFPYPPELYTLLVKQNEEEKHFSTILYPEPPLNKREYKLLKEYISDVSIVTPTYLLASKGVENLEFDNISIGLSVSEIQDNLIEKTNDNLAIMVIELCRYLVSMKMSIIYGGKIGLNTKYNFLDILYDLVSNYSFNADSEHVIKNYYLDRFLIPDEEKVKYSPIIEFIEVSSVSEGDNEKIILGNSLRKLREEINKHCFAKVVVGGKVENFMGNMPGIIEEALIAIKAGTPVFLLGGFGGAAELIAKTILGEKILLSADWTDKLTFIENGGYACLNNGLSVEDNEILVHSNNVSLNISLILKGIKNLITKS